MEAVRFTETTHSVTGVPGVLRTPALRETDTQTHDQPPHTPDTSMTIGLRILNT